MSSAAVQPRRRATALRHDPAVVLLRSELRRHSRELRHIWRWSLVEALPAFCSGLCLSAAITGFLTGDPAAGFGYLALLALAAVVGALATRQLFPWLAAIVEPVRDAFLRAVVHGAVAGAAARGHADTSDVVRVTEQVQSLRGMLVAVVSTLRGVVLTAVAALLGLTVLAPIVAVGAATLVVLTLGLFGLLLPRLVRTSKLSVLAVEELARQTGTAVHGVRDAVACGGEEQVASRVGAAIAQEAALARELARAAALRRIIVFVGGQLPVVVLLAAAPWLLATGRLSFAELVGAVTYLGTVIEPAVRAVVGAAGTWGVELVVTLARLGERIGAPRPAAIAAAEAPRRYDLAVRGLTFGYGPHVRPVVADLDLDFAEGDHVAVVGPSGIGKSTFAMLLSHLLAPQRGTVLLGGAPVDQIPDADLRRTLALIPQESYVFAGSLRENLTYLAPTATTSQVLRAARAVGLEPVVERLGGLDTRVGTGGAELSAGEKQLVALTRVHLSPARIVILDEATSHLDPGAEARAETAMLRRAGTLIVIAHRISSAQRARRVLLFDGHNVRQGGHDDLVVDSGLYADLVGRWQS